MKRMDSAHQNIWNSCLKIIKDNISPKEFEVWFKPLKPYSYKAKEKKLSIFVPSHFFYEYLETNYLDLMKKALKYVIGDGAKLEYIIKVVDNKKKTIEKNSVKVPENSLEKTVEMETQKSFAPPKDANPVLYPGIRKYKINSHLSPIYTFDNFVVGQCNEIAYYYSKQIAENPGKYTTNPFLIFGMPGVGKTHLLHAIGNKISELYPNYSILYIDAFVFQQQFTYSVQNNEFNDFLNFYRNIDILLFDDIQELANKDKTQKAFFNVFNFLQHHSKQIVITSDRYPSQLEGFFDKLLSRFKSGISVEIMPPNAETKFKILKNLAYREGIKVSDKVLEYIAEVSNSDIREIRGILFSLLATSVNKDKNLNLEYVKDFVRKFIKKQNKEVTLTKILKTVSEVTKISIQDMKSKKRQQEIVLARQIAMYFAKKMTSFSLSSIGKEFGNRDHATVLYSIKTIENLYTIDKSVKSIVDKIASLLNYNALINVG